MLLTISIKPLLKFDSVKVKDITLGFGIVICLLILAEKTILNNKIGFYAVYASMILLLVYLIIFLKYKSKKTDKNILLYVAVVFVCFEAFMNMYQTSISTIKRDDYMKNTQNIEEITNGLKNITDDFYRVERANMKTKDDGAFMHFPSSSIFSSSAYSDGTAFYKKMGMEASTNAYSITGSTPFADSLLSVKYKVFEEEEKNAKALNLREIANDGTVYMYQNIDTMPLSFVLTDDFLKDFDMTSGNPATVQNNFSRTLKLGTVLNKKSVEITGTTAKFTTEEDGDYYAFVRDKGIKEVVVNYPTTSKSFKNLNRGYLLELGYLDKDVEMSFRNDTNDDQLLIEVFRFNFETLKKVVEALKQNAEFKIISFDETRINYNLNVKNAGTCVISLPYDDGFKVFVDGEEVEKKKVMDFMLGFDVGVGQHEILVTYRPVGLLLGAIFTLTGILVLIAIYILDKKNIIKV